MDKALENACKGQSKSQGSMNVNELKILAKQKELTLTIIIHFH